MPPVKLCSSRRRSKIRFDVCCCFLGTPLSSLRILSMIAINGSSLGRIRDLQIIKTAMGINKNVFCEEVLVKVIRERVAELRAELEPGQWDVIVRCADGGRR